MSMESSDRAEEPESLATLSRKNRVAQKTPEMGNAAHESLAVIRRARRPERQRRSRRKRNNVNKVMMLKEETVNNGCSSTNKEEDEKAEVENKIVALQRIVPGGESLGVDQLFDETADYILALQFQVKALKFLATFVEGSDKEKRKLGG